MTQDAFKTEDVKALEEIVAQYADGHLARNDVVAALTKGIVSACAGSEIPFNGDLIIPYLEQLDALDEDERAAGSGAGGGPTGGSQGGEGNDDDDGTHDRPNKRSLYDRMSGPEPDDDEGFARVKRSKVDTSNFAWRSQAKTFLDSMVLTPAHENVLRQVEAHSDDVKEAVRDLLNTFHAPAIPESLWKNVLLDRFVDFDTILAGAFSTDAEESQQLVLGDSHVEIKKPKLVTKISTHGQWINAFRTYEDAVNFAFDGRVDELRAYWGHINDLFSTRNPSLHGRIINYDRAARNFVGLRRDILLSEFGKFRHVQDAHLLDGGIAVAPAYPPSGGSSKTKGPGGSGKGHSTPAIISMLAPNAMDVDTPHPTALTSAVEPELPARTATRFELAARAHIDWFADADYGGDSHDAISFMPKYMRGMAWKDDQHAPYSRTARYTETDEPLPRPPPSEFANLAVMKTIRDNPDLFQNPQVIKVDRLESLLSRHPNPLFVQSVIAGLHHGFWPWLDTHHADGYPETWDNSWSPPASDRERDFINSQRDIEITKGRFSRTFGPDLLPGMYSTPILAVPKPHSDDLRLVSHQSYGPFAPNTMVDKAKTKGPRMDTMQQFIPALLRFRRRNPGAELVVWKSDVSEAFRLTSVHKLAQIKQIATSNLPTKLEARTGESNGPVQRNVDWCSTFGNCGSPRIWASVMGLVIWIALFVKTLTDVFCYVDDTFGWELKSNLTYYPPYKKHIPTKQAQLLFLWDFLGIPHKEKKQLHGTSLPIIGFEVDPNAMTDFIDTPSRRRTLHEFQCLTGWMNWSFNMYFLLRPSLSNIYNKMADKSLPHAGIYINAAIKSDLTWFLGHLRASNGVLLFDSLDWNPITEADLTIYCDASLRLGMGFWIPELLLGFYSPVPGAPPAETIFFFEALCVVSALRWFCLYSLGSLPRTRRLRVTIFTDNQNTVNIFNSLCATPNYNLLLRTAVDELVEHQIDLRVLHVKGEDNYVADAISRQRFSAAAERASGLNIQNFQPPQEPMGLVHKRAVAMGAAIDRSTANTYGSALNSYLEFCRLHGLPIEPTADTLSFYTVFMCHHIEPRSVDSYLSGICNQLEAHFPQIRETRKSMLVARTLQGCKRLRGTALHDALLSSGIPLDPISKDELPNVVLWLEQIRANEEQWASLISTYRQLCGTSQESLVT
ncbi:hypothetical protein C8R43DRAFT_1135075 [Mycena crocata]|nr:hypothetical protein C8R43DRAFT_1135075 [Mycena crocata]